jgi:aryl-alcohol dehydrogenase-like predicted oxidoreductase
MEYRTIGNSDLECSTVTFGAWALGGWMWGGTEQNESVEAIHAAFDHGITSFDTAPVYGQGHSEKVVGKVLKDFPRGQIQILTKYGMRWDVEKGEFAFASKDNEGSDIDIYRYAAKASVIKECEDSLRRLQTDYIDLYQIHWPDPTTPIKETMEAIQQLKKQGKIRHAAVCNYSVELLKEADKYVDIVSDQVPYSMLRRNIEEDVAPWCMETGKSILAYSPLQRGLLTGKMEPGQDFNEGDDRANSDYYSDENIRKTNGFLQEIKPIAEKHDATLAQIVIQWTVSQPGITIALVGARNVKQATQNARAADIDLSSQEIDDITGRLSKMSFP